MAHVNRRIGKSSETANVTVDGTGGGVLDAFLNEYFNRSGNVVYIDWPHGIKVSLREYTLVLNRLRLRITVTFSVTRRDTVSTE